MDMPAKYKWVKAHERSPISESRRKDIAAEFDRLNADIERKLCTGELRDEQPGAEMVENDLFPPQEKPPHP
jgi:hypothetical protein